MTLAFPFRNQQAKEDCFYIQREGYGELKSESSAFLNNERTPQRMGAEQSALLENGLRERGEHPTEE